MILQNRLLRCKKIEKTFLENEKKEEHCITIAASTIPAQYLLPEILVKFNEKYPNEQFKVIKTDSAGVGGESAESYSGYRLYRDGHR